MRIITADDEPAALELLTEAVREAAPDAETACFDDTDEVLSYAEKNKTDIAFLDIHMRKTDGVELAKRLKKFNPAINVIFVTGYVNYMSDALTIHASGYINKPVTCEAVKEQLGNLLHPIDPTRNGIYAQTFGHFELYVNGTPVSFRREKSKELLAILVDRRGASLTTEQIASVMFEERNYDRGVKNTLMPIIRCMQEALEAAGADILIKSWGHLAVDTTKFRCDAYDYEAGQVYAVNLFKGEYMSNYSWAEERAASFYWNGKDT